MERIIYANESFLCWLGFVHDDIAGKALKTLVAGDTPVSEESGPRNVCLKDHNGCQHQASISQGIDLGYQVKRLFLLHRNLKSGCENKMNFTSFGELAYAGPFWIIRVLVNRPFEQLVRERKILGRSLKDWLRESVHERYGEF